MALSPTGDETNDDHKLVSFPSDSTLNSVSLAEADAVQGQNLFHPVQIAIRLSGNKMNFQFTVTLDATTPSRINGKEQTHSQEYITQFLNLYKNKSSDNLAMVSNDDKIKEENYSAPDKPWSLFGWSLGSNNKARLLNAEGERSPSEEFVFTVPRDPHLSPYLASAGTLAQMPPVKILVPD